MEAKCILWPDDSIQFANYRGAVEQAVKQIVRKKAAVQRNYVSFSDRLKELGYDAPPVPHVVCCVLTNSAVYSGFPVDGVPIVDLSILKAFLMNEYVKLEGRDDAGKIIQRHAINFYTDAVNASSVLENYLSEPPQVLDMRRSVKKRETILPVESPGFGKLVHETYKVEIDFDAMLKRYGMANATH